MKEEELKGEDCIIIPYKVGVINNGKKIIIGQMEKKETHKDKQLIHLVSKAYQYHNSILEGKRLEELSQEEHLSTRYILRVLQISFINPKIIKQILEGKQPRSLTREQLENLTKIDIEEQEKSMI